MKLFLYNLLLSTGLFLAAAVPMAAQNVPFKGKAKVIECPPPHTMLKVDLLDDDLDFIREMAILPETKIVTKKGDPAEAKSLAPGTEVEISGEKVNYKNRLTEIKILTMWVGDIVEVDGLLDFFDPATSTAFVDGQKVRLAPGEAIKGDPKSPLKGKKYDSFAAISLGNFLSGEGKRQADGSILLEQARVRPNDFDASDKKLSEALMNEFSAKGVSSVVSPSELAKYGMQQLDRGFVSFGDAQFKLHDSLRVQAYVNYVGQRIVPEWQKNIPDDAPEKIHFRFFVIENPTFNAFALPNGMIFVHTGLLSQLENEAQLATVLGHEIGHVTQEHAKERFDQQEKIRKAKEFARTAINTLRPNVKSDDMELGLNLASDLLTDEALSNPLQALPYLKNKYVPGVLGFLDQLEKMPPQTKKAIGSLFSGVKGIASNDHSREREAQSDRVGLFYMQQAGYDPREAPKVWKKFMDQTADKNFMEKMNRTAKDWITTTEMYPYPNPLQAAGDFLVGKMADKFLDNWFSSHPKAKKRYRSLNLLVATNFSEMDFSGAMVNLEEFREVKGVVGK